jgi:hypothetical protein
MADERGNIFGSYRSEVQKILDNFNSSVDGKFRVESRVLVPAEGPYSLDKRGIIVEYLGKLEDFETLFQQYSKELTELAHKLDKRTSLYEYPFTSEFCHIDKWVDYNNTKVAYNYEL